MTEQNRPAGRPNQAGSPNPAGRPNPAAPQAKAGAKQPTGPGKPAAPNYKDRVAVLAANTAKTCRQVGLHAAAVRLPEEGSISRVLVVGDSGSGKSRFVGALIGAPGLLPVGVPHSQITVRHGDPSVTVAAADGSIYEATLADVAQLASEPMPHRPLSLDVSLRSRVLPGLEIVDLPGGDGLGGAQGQVALAMADGFDAVLLVHDSNGPIREGEKAFLAAVAERVGFLMVVFNKTDIAPDFMVVLEHARRTLGRTPALRSVVYYDASAANYERSKRQDAIGGRLVEPLRRFSGMDPIRDFLTKKVAGRSAQLRLAGTARECAALLRRCADIVDREARLGDEEEVARADRAWQDVIASEAAVRTQLRGQVQGMRSAPRTQLDTAIRELREELRAFADKCPKSQLDMVPDRLQSRLVVITSEVWTTQTDAALAATHVLTDKLRGMDELEQMHMALAQTDVSDSVSANLGAGVGSPSATYQRSLQSSSRATMTRTALLMVPGVLAAAAGPIGWPVGIALAAGGVGIGALMVSQGKATDAQYRQHLRQWVDSTLNESQRGLMTALDTRAQFLAQHLDSRVLELLAAAKQEREHVKAYATTMRNDPELQRQRERAATLRKVAGNGMLLADQITGMAPPPSS